MIFDGITLVEGSEIRNLVVQSGPELPVCGTPTPPDKGELFYLLSPTAAMLANGYVEGLYINKADCPTPMWARLIGSNETISDTLPNIIAAGTYRSVTVNTKGFVTAGTNPTTLAGYGITDAQPLDEDLTAISHIAGISGLLRKTGINSWTLDTGTYLTGNQTITLTGDVSGSGATSIPVTLVNTGVAAGTYGTSSNVAVVGIDSKGRVVSATNTPIQLDASAITSGTFANGRISQTSVTQHQAALSITETQIVDGSILTRNAGNETISGSWSFVNPVTGATPTAGGHLATKSYVDNLALGLDFKESVRAATTGPITLSGLQTVDDISIDDGNRVLVKDQVGGTANGVYLARTGTWERAPDADGTPASEVSPGMFCFVEEGTAHGDTAWVLSTNGTITLGVTPLIFTKFSGGGASAPTIPQNSVAYGEPATGEITGGDFLTFAENSNGAGTSNFLTVTGRTYGEGANGAEVAIVTRSPSNPAAVRLISDAYSGIFADFNDFSGNRPVLNITSTSFSRSSAIEIKSGQSTGCAFFGGNSGGWVLIESGYGQGGYSSGNVIIKTGNSSGSDIGAFDAGFGEGKIVFATSEHESFVQTDRLSILNDGAWAVGPLGTETGTTGQVLTSNGPNSPPTWQNAGGANSVGYGLTASGVNLAAALALTNGINHVSNVSVGTGVRLPTVIGQTTIVINRGANALNVYPVSGGTIDGQVAGAATIVPAGARIMFVQVSSTEYFTLNATYA